MRFKVAVHRKIFLPNADRRILEAALRGLTKTVLETREEMLHLTSGNTSTAQLRRMGHPYARNRFPSGQTRVSLPLLPINRQTGDLQRSLFTFPFTTETSFGARLGFDSRHARFVLARGGTRYMLDRLFWQTLDTFVTSRFNVNIAVAVKEAFGR